MNRLIVLVALMVLPVPAVHAQPVDKGETADFMVAFYKKKTDSKDTLSDAEKRDLVAFLRVL